MVELLPIEVAPSLICSLLFIGVMVMIVKKVSFLLRLYIITRNIPGPRGRLLIGSMLDVLDPFSLFHFTNKCTTKYGRMFKVWVAYKLNIVSTDINDVKIVFKNLKNHDKIEQLSGPLRGLLGNGIIMMRDGHVYETHKRIMSPLFYSKMLKNYIIIFEEKICTHCTTLSQIADGRNINIYYHISQYILDTLCSTIIGCDVSNMYIHYNELVEKIKVTEQAILQMTVQPWLGIPWINRCFANGRKIISNEEFSSRFIDTLVKGKFQAKSKSSDHERNATGDKIRTTEVSEEKKVLTMLDMMIQESESQGEHFSTRDIRDEIMTFILAGFGTTAGALCYCFILLGIHQDVQEEVLRELEDVFGSATSKVTTKQLGRLEVLDRVIKEAFRLFPIVPSITRKISEDIELPTGRILPAGSDFIVSIYHIHRNPEYYENPNSFIPDRWRPENSSYVNADAFLPFGYGPRFCMGFRYATLQMKVTLVNLLRRFKITTTLKMEDLTKLGFSVTLHCNSELKVQLHKRESVSN